MRRLVFAIPGELATPTGGYAYDRRVIAELIELGWNVEVMGLGNGFPYPDVPTVKQATSALAALSLDAPVIIDGLALGVLPKAATEMTAPLIALVHHPLALETGITPTQAAVFRTSERAALAVAKIVVATSAATARVLSADYGVTPERIVVAEPGTDRVSSKPRRESKTVRLLAVGAISPRKGYDVLISALALLADLPWHLTIVGATDRNPDCVAALQSQIANASLGTRIEIAGAVSDERLNELYAEADGFVLASRFEGYGMAYAEAIAHGLPVIGTNAGAIPDTVPSAAAILVAPDDIAALVDALRRVISDRATRAKMAIEATKAAASLPTWRQSAEKISQLIEGLS